jgi:steroid delta-isomerase-like uncharacterized protein
MPVKQNIELMQRWFQEVWNEGRIETVHELFAADGVAIGQAGRQALLRGPQEFVPFVERIRGAFPDIKITIEDTFGRKDKVVVRWSASMTHTGDSLGIPATRRPVRVTGMTIVRIVKGKLVEGWDNWDQLGMLEQIGAYQQLETMKLPKSA